jgi:hypothetical protein
MHYFDLPKLYDLLIGPNDLNLLILFYYLNLKFQVLMFYFNLLKLYGLLISHYELNFLILFFYSIAKS